MTNAPLVTKSYAWAATSKETGRIVFGTISVDEPRHLYHSPGYFIHLAERVEATHPVQGAFIIALPAIP